MSTKRCASVSFVSGGGVLIEMGPFDKDTGRVVLPPEPLFGIQMSWGPPVEVGFVVDNPWQVREVFSIKLPGAMCCVNCNDYWTDWRSVAEFTTRRVVSRTLELLESRQRLLFPMVVPLTYREFFRPERQRAIYELHCALRQPIEED